MTRYRFLLAAMTMLCLGPAASISLADTAHDAQTETLQTRIAKARLRFAELGLKRVEQFNARFANSVSGTIVDEYRRDVDVAKRRVQALAAGSATGPFDYWLDHVQTVSRDARDEYDHAQLANKTYAGTIDAVDVERMQVRAELFQLLYEEGRQLADKPVIEQLAWQNNVLLAELQYVSTEVFRNLRISGDHD